MGDLYKKINIFLASPHDVQKERGIVADVINRLNRTVANKRGLVLDFLGWEAAVPDMGPPQSVINRQLSEYDVFIGIMWKRFGTATQVAGSGTEEEFNRAYEAWSLTSDRPRILFYFSERAIPFPANVEEVDQLRKVLEFKERVTALGLCATYQGIEKFKWLVHGHLEQIIMDWPAPGPAPDELEPKVSSPDAEFENNLDALNAKLDQLSWVVYDPVEFDPEREVYPSEASVRKDLETLAQGPFNGIITIGSENSLGSVPRIARECGIRGVIMGVYSLRDPGELRAALEAGPYVDGYCLGHKGLGIAYNAADLHRVLTSVREKTKRPVSTTESLSDYLANPEVAGTVDWLFPDVHYYWHEGATPEEVIADLMGKINIIQDWLKHQTKRRAVLKMISYPSSGAPGHSELSQAHFFARFLRRVRNDTGIARYIRFTFFAAFDNGWKKPDRGWSQAELSTGLYTVERTPKAALEFIKNPWREIDDG